MDILNYLQSYFKKIYPQYQFFFSLEENSDILKLRLYHKEFQWNVSEFRSELQLAQQIRADLYYAGFVPKYDYTLKPGFVIPSQFNPEDFLIDDKSIFEKPPEQYTWRKDSKIPVLDQKDTSMCVAYTLVTAYSYFYYKKHNIYMDFSPEFIYSHRLMSNVDQGMSIQMGLNCILKYGLLPKDQWKPNIPINQFYSSTKNYKIKGYARIGSVESAKFAIYRYSPLVISLPIKSNQQEFWKGDKLIVNHACLIIGYRKNDFIIQNSWGSQWGDNGFTYLKFSEWHFVNEAWCLLTS